MNVSRAAPRRAGVIIGRVTKSVVFSREAPQVWAASSNAVPMRRNAGISRMHMNGTVVELRCTRVMPQKPKMLSGPSVADRPSSDRTHWLMSPSAGSSSRIHPKVMDRDGTKKESHRTTSTTFPPTMFVRAISHARVHAMTSPMSVRVTPRRIVLTAASRTPGVKARVQLPTPYLASCPGMFSLKLFHRRTPAGTAVIAPTRTTATSPARRCRRRPCRSSAGAGGVASRSRSCAVDWVTSATRRPATGR